tara:strand:+ start:30786 stop:31499 length:714 start_codon:yes stop_codon:yes gene_type:complete
MIYCFDIDGTLCDTDGNNYPAATPYPIAIREVKRLYEEGHTIQMFTARGTTSKIDWTDLTKKQLEEWGAPYHELIMNVKPSFDIVIDDRAINALEWRAKLEAKVGFVAGAFDIIHPGYIKMFEDAKTVCDHLIVALQTDPTIDRPEKNKPVQTYEERKTILSSIRYVDEVVEYTTEKDLYNLLKILKIDVRILGTDYLDTKYNGCDLDIPIHYHTRDHSWSASGLKQLIKQSLKEIK